MDAEAAATAAEDADANDIKEDQELPTPERKVLSTAAWRPVRQLQMGSRADRRGYTSVLMADAKEMEQDDIERRWCHHWHCATLYTQTTAKVTQSKL